MLGTEQPETAWAQSLWSTGKGPKSYLSGNSVRGDDPEESSPLRPERCGGVDKGKGKVPGRQESMRGKKWLASGI